MVALQQCWRALYLPLWQTPGRMRAGTVAGRGNTTGGPTAITDATVVRSGAGLSRGVERIRAAGITSAGATVIVTEVNTPEAIALRVDRRFQRSLVKFSAVGDLRRVLVTS